MIANISGTDQAVDKRYEVRFFSTLSENNLVNFGPLTKKWPWPLNFIGFVRLSQYMFMQNFIKLRAAVRELSRPQTKQEHKGNARQQCMYEGPLRTNVKSVKTSILVLKVIQGHCFRVNRNPCMTSY